MSTTPTQLPVPSEKPQDLKFNAGKIDEFVTSLAQQYIDRFGHAHYTIEGLKQLVLQHIYNLGWNPVGTFQGGATIINPGDIIQDTTDKAWYRWDDLASLPKTVPSGSTPGSTGGTGVGKWQPVDVSDVLRRDLASSVNGKGDALVAHGGLTLNKFLSVKDMTEKYSVKLRGNQVVKIDLYGDSTMWGAWQSDLSQQSPKEPGVSLLRALGIIFGSTTHSVSNKAISGTSLQQMLDGTDGSGKTFAQRISESTADIVYCNHAMNDMQSNGDLVQFENNLITAIQICINAGKLFIYCTPNAVTPGPTDQYLEGKPVRIQWFSDVIKKVCQNYGIPVVDNNYFFLKTLMRLPQSAVLSDGVHPTDLMYEQMGFNLAIPLVKCNVLKSSGDAQSTAGCDVYAGPVRSQEVWSSSKFGSVIYADGQLNDIKKISIPFIYDSDCDIKIVTPMFTNGPSSVGCIYQASNDQNINHSQAPSIPAVLVSNESTVFKGGTIPCGLAVITVYVSNLAAKVGLEGIVLRKSGGVTLPIVSVENGDSALLQELFVDTQLYTTTVSFSGIIGKSCGLNLMRLQVKDSSTASQSRARFGLNASGHPVIGLLNSSGDYDYTELNATDYSTSMHSYALAITKGLNGSVFAYVDGVRVGGLTMSNSFQGGKIGIYSSTGNNITITGVTAMGRV